jgi:hypothetical protein
VTFRPSQICFAKRHPRIAAIVSAEGSSPSLVKFSTLVSFFVLNGVMVVVSRS